MISEEFLSCATDVMTSWSLLAQDEGAAPADTTIGRILQNPFTPIVGLFLLFYFIFIMPERRRKAEESRMMSSLKKNDRIVTIGGIHATVVAAPQDSKVVTIKIDEAGNTRVKINRSAIAAIVSEKDGDSAKKSSKESAPETKDD